MVRADGDHRGRSSQGRGDSAASGKISGRRAVGVGNISAEVPQIVEPFVQAWASLLVTPKDFIRFLTGTVQWGKGATAPRFALEV